MAYRIGILVGEYSERPGGMDWARVWQNCVELAIEEVQERNAIDQPIEILTRQVEGLPTGSQHAVTTAWSELAAEGVLGILGPANADNGMAVQKTANEGQIVTVLFGCSERLASEWTFGMPWGAAPEDSFLAMNWVRQQGLKSVALLWDTAWHGEEWMLYARLAAQRFGIDIVGDVRIPCLVVDDQARKLQLESARQGVERLRELRPDALVMMTSHGAIPFGQAVHDLQWDVPRVVAGGSFAAARHMHEVFNGWAGTGLRDEANSRSVAFLAKYEERFGTPLGEDMLFAVHDGSRALLEAIALAPIKTREGVRDGMEQIKYMPATAGGPETVISYGPYNHRGYHGRDMSVLRKQEGPNNNKIGYFSFR